MNCRQCAKPLKQCQGRFCSKRCADLGKIIARTRDCERCSKALTKRQIGDAGRYCSRACASKSRRALLPDRDCPACGKALRREQFKNPGGHCSVACARPHAWPAPRRTAILAVLRANAHTWLTTSDLAIWLYGDDGSADCRAVQQLFYWLRRAGYAIASRRAAWEWAQGPSRAYRLISEPATKAREAA